MDSETLRFLSELEAGRQALDIAGAVLLLAVGWIAAGWVKRAVRRALDRVERLDPTLAPLIAGSARYAILIFVVVAVVAQLGIQTTSILAALGAAGLAIGLAFAGHAVECRRRGHPAGAAAVQGGRLYRRRGPDRHGRRDRPVHHQDARLRRHLPRGAEQPDLEPLDFQLRAPGDPPTRRVALTVGIGHGDDMDAALATLRELMGGDGRVLTEPASNVRVTDLGDSAVILTPQCWATTGDHRRLLGPAPRPDQGKQAGAGPRRHFNSLPTDRHPPIPRRRGGGRG